jgi:hypothetical protein
MNKLLTQKNESEFKKNSADFYLLTVFSKEILGFDKFRLENYFNVTKQSQNKSMQQKNILRNKKYKIVMFIGLSCYFLIRFKSVLIIPAFYVLYIVLQKIFNKIKGYNKVENQCICYFCLQNEEKEKSLLRYNKYFKVVDYIIDRNPGIKTWEEFEKEYKIYKSLN